MSWWSVRDVPVFVKVGTLDGPNHPLSLEEIRVAVSRIMEGKGGRGRPWVAWPMARVIEPGCWCWAKARWAASIASQSYVVRRPGT